MGQRAQVGRTEEVRRGVVFVFGVVLAGQGCGGSLLGRSVCFSLGASMREKGLARAGGAQGRDAMTLKLLFWELEKHLKR